MAEYDLPQPINVLNFFAPSSLTEDERNLRKRRYLALCDLLTLMGSDPDDLSVCAYGELIAAAIDALKAEQSRIATRTATSE